jgi:hypothetical protein
LLHQRFFKRCARSIHEILDLRACLDQLFELVLLLQRLSVPISCFSNADTGLDRFIDSVSDIKLFFQTYSYSGN